MEALGPNTPVTPTPPVPNQQTPLAAPLPSLPEHTAVLLQMQAALNSAAAKLAELAPAEQVARDDPAGSSRGDGDPEAVERSARGEGERLSEEAEELGKEVERMLGKAQGMWAGVERLRSEMDQWATEIVCSTQERQRIKGRIEELGKEDERVLLEMAWLHVQDDKVVKKSPGEVEQWYPPLRLTENREWDEFDKKRAERIRVKGEVQKAGEELDRTEPEREKLIMCLATVLRKKVKVEAEARASVVETERLRVEVERLAAEVVQLKVEVELRESVVETERLMVEAERLGAEVARQKVEGEAERAPRD